MLKVTCECGRRFQVSDQEAGKRGTCHCGQVVQIPGPPLSDTVSLAGLEYETSTSLERPSDGIGSPQARDSIGHYALVRKLGEGAMGEVWLARDEHLDREVAIKFLHAHVSRDQDQLRRFMREAKLMAKLDHPHVVRVIHLGDTGDHFYLVIEYVRGGSLEDHVRETGPLPWWEATRAIRDAASGLAEAHRQELIHRDIKPANLLRTPDGKTKVSDFGLVRHLTQGSELTQHGTVMGSPPFMAPEQWEGKQADERTDLYALTCSYYFLLTGESPFQAATWEALIYQHLHAPLPDVRRALPTIPEGVGRILQRGSQKDPAQRYQSASELLTDLEQLLGPELASDTLATVPSPREVAREPTVKPAGPNRSTWRHGTNDENSGRFTTSRVATTAAGLLLVILLGLAGLSWPLSRHQLFPGPRLIADNAAPSDIDRPTDATHPDGDGPQPPQPSPDPDDVVDTSGNATSDAPSNFEPTTVESPDGLDADVEPVAPPSTPPVATVVPRPADFEYPLWWMFRSAGDGTGTAAGEVRMFNQQLNLEMVWCPPGMFTMGSPQGEIGRDDDEDQIKVTLTHGFWLGRTEVTQGQWKAVMQTEPWTGKEAAIVGDRVAASYISWDDADAFCRKLTDQERQAKTLAVGWSYGLPDEACWEYACRAGQSTAYCYGNDPGRLDDYARYQENTLKAGKAYAQDVGLKTPNAWGLFDMHGNVAEWCSSPYSQVYDSTTRPMVPHEETKRTLRGGAWNMTAELCRSAARDAFFPDSGTKSFGFRVLLKRDDEIP